MTVGGTTSGYSLIGSCGNAIRPARKISADRTPAKIGRLMKNCESFMTLPRRVSSERYLRKMSGRMGRTCARRRHLGEAASGIAHGNAGSGDTLSGPNMLQTVDDDEIARGKSLGYDPQAVDFRSEFDEAVLDAVVLGQRQHKLL